MKKIIQVGALLAAALVITAIAFADTMPDVRPARYIGHIKA